LKLSDLVIKIKVIPDCMLSKNKAKLIMALKKKKVREEEGLFVIEGDKLVKEFLLAKIPLKMLIAKPEFLSSLTPEMRRLPDEIYEVNSDELRHISTLKNPQNSLALVKIKEKIPDTNKIFRGLTAALDSVQDPGNLGTIIRAAAWFGIKNIICSYDCADIYNPKVIQASMGALLHVDVYYSDLKILLGLAREKMIPVFGTMLEGESIYDHKPGNNGIIILGNESKGISGELIPFITDKIMIPGSGRSKPGIDSLNVGMAASVVFSEFLRKSGRLKE
jgi:RNA methyltransferase, TrmH family